MRFVFRTDWQPTRSTLSRVGCWLKFPQRGQRCAVAQVQPPEGDQSLHPRRILVLRYQVSSSDRGQKVNGSSAQGPAVAQVEHLERGQPADAPGEPPVLSTTAGRTPGAPTAPRSPPGEPSVLSTTAGRTPGAPPAPRSPPGGPPAQSSRAC